MVSGMMAGLVGIGRNVEQKRGSEDAGDGQQPAERASGCAVDESGEGEHEKKRNGQELHALVAVQIDCRNRGDIQ